MSTDFFNSAQSAVTYAATVAELILLVRLAWLKLLQEFKIFSVFLAFDAILTVALLSWDYHAYGYEWIWAVTAPLWTLLLAGAAFELSRGLSQPFPSETGNRNAALYGFLIGMTVSAAASMLAHPQAVLRPAVVLSILNRQCILSGCILGIVSQGAYLALGGAPLLANWKLHRRLLLTFLTVLVIGLFASTAKQRQYVDWSNLLRSISFLGCFCVWIAGFKPAFSHLRRPSGSLTNAELADTLVFHKQPKTRVNPALLPDTKRRENPV